MATIWTGAIDGDLSNNGNYDSAVSPSDSIVFSTLNMPLNEPSSGTLTCASIGIDHMYISAGTYNGDTTVGLDGVILGGIFSLVKFGSGNPGTLSGGTIAKVVLEDSSYNIDGSPVITALDSYIELTSNFNNIFLNTNVTLKNNGNYGQIKGGTWNGDVTLADSSTNIFNLSSTNPTTFRGTVTLESGCDGIYGGVFEGAVVIHGGGIYCGVFKGNISGGSGTIYGGIFQGDVSVNEIYTGVFTKTASAGTIHGGIWLRNGWVKDNQPTYGTGKFINGLNVANPDYTKFYEIVTSDVIGGGLL
jgi:hypothetical protein